MRKPQAKRRETFGRVDKRDNGRTRARYVGPDGKLHTAPTTFNGVTDARAWLVDRQSEIANGKWLSPDVVAEQEAKEAAEVARRAVKLSDYATKWIKTRTNSKGEPLRDRTREEYERMLRAPLKNGGQDKGGPLAELLPLVIGDITPDVVLDWRAAQIERGTLTQTSRAYDLLKSIMKTAVQSKLITENPCQIRGGSITATGKSVEPPTDDELAVILESIDARYRALVVVAAIGGLRYGEATELRAKSVTVERDDDGAVFAVRLNIRGGVVKAKAGRVVGNTKSTAGVRSLAIFGDDALIVAEQVKDKIGDALLFTDSTGAGHLPQSSFWRHWHKAVVAAKREDLPFHALRHYAGTRYAQSGATPRETMARLGHSSIKAAMRYQHSGNRDDELAARMSRRSTSA